MTKSQFYTLPNLPYPYDGLSPFISEEQLRIHYNKHHQAYVNNTNALLEKLEKSRSQQLEIDIKSTLKELSFQLGGHILHSLFWTNLRPPKEKNQPQGKLDSALKKEFGSIEQFQKEFTQAASSVEGSGWAALSFSHAQRLMITQIEKHNVNLYPNFHLLMVLDVWEHAYYLDYKNDRTGFIQGFWRSVNWEEIEKRFQKITG